MREVIGAFRHDGPAAGTGAMLDLVSFRDDGDALLARNTALEAENAQLRDENEQLKATPESTALVRKTPSYIEVQNREPWWKRGAAVALWVIAIAVAIAQGVL